MLVSLLIIAVAAAGGFAITYLIEDDKPFMWRLAAGNVIGSAIFGTLAFVLSSLVGLSPVTVVAALAITLSAIALLYDKQRRGRFATDWTRAKGKLQGATARKSLRFFYYAFFFLLFFFFFDRAMLETSAGIFTGGSQNLGDLPFHLGAIFSFTEANNLPPQNPSFAGAKFSYPFVADFLTACSIKLGAGVRDAMFVQNVAWAFSLLVVIERFVLDLTTDRLAARLAAPLLFFSGGLGFVWFFGDYMAQGKSLLDFVNALPKDYTIGDGFRWGNSMVVMFITQRSLLLGMPLTLIVLGYLWRVFTSDEPTDRRLDLRPLLVGLLAGLLPLIHLHSLAVLFVAGVFLFVLKPERWMTWLTFAAGVAIVAIPELAWSMSGSASDTAKFFAWKYGWDKGETNFFWFWLKNTGGFIPLLIAGIVLLALPQSRKDAAEESPGKKVESEPSLPPPAHRTRLLVFYGAFAFCFLVSNVAKLAPWEWDNIKVLIYWFVGSIPFVALLIAWLWRRASAVEGVIAALLFIVLIFSGVLDVWRTVSGQINYKVFDADAVEIADQIKRRVPPTAMFLNAPTYNTAVVLTGRQSVMRYPGHLSSHGIDYASREADVKRIYQGGPGTAELMAKYGVEYVLVSPDERNAGGVNEQFFSRFPVAAEAGQYRVYRIKER